MTTGNLFPHYRAGLSAEIVRKSVPAYHEVYFIRKVHRARLDYTIESYKVRSAVTSRLRSWSGCNARAHVAFRK